METEIKLSPVEPYKAALVFGDELLSPFLGDVRRSDMESVYYKDHGRMLDSFKASLRLRSENGEGICCLKISSGVCGYAKIRREYEVRAENIAAGISSLCTVEDIPQDIRDILKSSEFTAVCGCDFTRTEADYVSPTLHFILSYDIGEYRKGELSAPLGEIELELVDGSAAELSEIAEEIIKKHGLPLCEISKYQKAMSLEEPDGEEAVL